ncbi:MAG: endonuclease III [Paludibacteraceae bacterium]|nr:endonuclease III [Paludibacteraceae bacterium]
MKVKERYSKILEWFEANMPQAQSELNYSNPFELLVAVILSAQCTDKRVNMVTPSLFAAYPTAEAMAQASAADVFSFIHSVSYPNAKAEHLAAMARKLVSDYNGQVPCDEEQLISLPGVGRKTAHVVMAVIWNQPTMAVDTHIFRISERLGLTTNSKSVLATERQLTKYIPAELIPKAHHWLLLHGRYVCTARKPHCERCGIRDFCRFYTK